MLAEGRENNDRSADTRPKKEFLKRKKPAYVPPTQP